MAGSRPHWGWLSYDDITRRDKSLFSLSLSLCLRWRGRREKEKRTWQPYNFFLFNKSYIQTLDYFPSGGLLKVFIDWRHPGTACWALFVYVCAPSGVVVVIYEGCCPKVDWNGSIDRLSASLLIVIPLRKKGRLIIHYEKNGIHLVKVHLQTFLFTYITLTPTIKAYRFRVLYSPRIFKTICYPLSRVRKREEIDRRQEDKTAEYCELEKVVLGKTITTLIRLCRGTGVKVNQRLFKDNKPWREQSGTIERQ